MQRSEQWFRQRRGKLTASNLGQAVGLAPWGSPQALAAQLRKDVAPAEDANKPVDAEPKRKHNPALARGTNKEPNGVLEYVSAMGTHVEPTGFWAHPDLDWLGGSPDGLLGTDGLLEIKCPCSRKLYPVIPPTSLPTKPLLRRSTPCVSLDPSRIAASRPTAPAR